MGDKYGINENAVIELNAVLDYADEHLVTFEYAMEILSVRIGLVMYHEFETFQLN